MLNTTLERLTKRSEYLNVSKKGRRCIKPAFIVQACAHRDNAMVRYGITASRKVGGAVERNRAKRRLRALIKQILPAYGSPGMDYVVIARKAALSRAFARMIEELKAAMHELHSA